MQFRSRYYTYPVIDSSSDFYEESLFETDVEQVLDGYNIKLILKANLVNKELKGMLENGLVEIIHHIECPQTCFRTAVKTNTEVTEYLIKDKNVNGTLQVYGFLVASENLNKYTNELFSKDFRGFSFNIDKGCVMAIGNPIELRINKIKDDIANTSSILTISKNLDPTVTDMKINLTETKIVILLPGETYSMYENMSSFMDIQPVMHSMVIVPTLLYVFNELKASKEQLFNYEDYRWFRGLKKSCSKMGITLDQEGVSSLEPLELSQKLVDTPINDAFGFLMTGGDDYED